MGSTKKFWFAPKVYGYGYTPISWEGRLIMLVIVGLVVVSSFFFFSLNAGEPEVYLVGGYLLWAIFLSFLPLLLWKKRFAAPLRWRWGVKDIDRE